MNNKKEIQFNSLSLRMGYGLYWFFFFFTRQRRQIFWHFLIQKIKEKNVSDLLQALNMRVISTRIQQHLDLIDFNILGMFRPAILHRGLTSALRGLCVSAQCNRETLSEIDRLGFREPPSVPQPLCLRYWSPYVNACMRVRACTWVSFLLFDRPISFCVMYTVAFLL